MLKTYRIIPLVFILFLFGFTLITVAPVIAQEQWNPSMGMCHNSRPCMIANSCGKQCAVNVRESKGWLPPAEHKARMAAQSPEQVSTSPSDADGPWDKSMGMRHPARPCMVKGPGRDGTGLGPRGCGRDMRSPEEIASDPYDTNNPVSLAARGEKPEVVPTLTKYQRKVLACRKKGGQWKHLDNICLCSAGAWGSQPC